MAPPFQFDLVCIGSGPAGQRAAVQAAKLGKKVAVIERAQCLGGVCVNTGTIPSKTFREAVVAHALALRTNRGAQPLSRTDLATQLLSRVSDVVQREFEVIENQLGRNDVVLMRGTAAFEDAHSIVVETPDGFRRVSASHFVVAVGTRPARPPGEDLGPDLLLTSDMLLSMRELPRTLAVVGGGVIGIEYASMFAALGVQVTLIERHERPLEFLDHEIVDELLHQMRNHNVTLRLREAVAKIEAVGDKPRRASILLESGKRLVSDFVLYSIGRVGSTEGLGLEKAGIPVDERGRITVDENLRTCVPHVYAAGDVIGFPALAATSSEQGRLAACHAFGVEARPMESHFPVGIYAIPELSSVGLTEERLTEQKVPYEVGVARYREIARGQILGDDTGFLKMLFHRETRNLLGVHAIGTHATELIHIGQAVIGLGGGLDYFLRTVFNYPTLAECYKVAALDAANRLAR